MTAAYDGSLPSPGGAAAWSRYSFQDAYSSRARAVQPSGARQPPSADPSSWRPRRASPTTEWARCFVASYRPAFSAIRRMSSFRKTLHDPVVKSWSRVPTAITTSASAASALADELPVTPMGPAKLPWSQGSEDWPATVSTTGRPCRSANRASSCSASDQGALGGPEQRGGGLHLVGVRAGPPDAVDARLEERSRVLERHGLHVLREPDEGGPAVRRVEHRGHGLGEGVQDLLGPDDPVPVPGDRPEGVVHRGRRVVEVLHLLQHRIVQAAGERVAGQQEEGEPVRVGDPRRRHHVRGPGADGARRHHDLAAPSRLRERHGGHGHGLLVLAPPRGEPVARGLQGVSQARHVPVAEDREDPGEQRSLLAVDNGSLGDQEPHDRLCDGQPRRLHGPPVLALARRAGPRLTGENRERILRPTRLERSKAFGPWERSRVWSWIVP